VSSRCDASNPEHVTLTVNNRADTHTHTVPSPAQSSNSSLDKQTEG